MLQKSLDYLKITGPSHLHDLLEEMSTQTPDKQQLDVAVGIVSVERQIDQYNRYQPQYLTQVFMLYVTIGIQNTGRVYIDTCTWCQHYTLPK